MHDGSCRNLGEFGNRMYHFLATETVKLVWGPSHIFSKIKAMRLNNISVQGGEKIKEGRGEESTV